MLRDKEKVGLVTENCIESDALRWSEPFRASLE